MSMNKVTISLFCCLFFVSFIIPSPLLPNFLPSPALIYPGSASKHREAEWEGGELGGKVEEGRGAASRPIAGPSPCP